MQNETSFLILDGAYVHLICSVIYEDHVADTPRMIAIAVSLLTLAYPGLWFPPMRRNKKHAVPATQEAGVMQD